MRKHKAVQITDSGEAEFLTQVVVVVRRCGPTNWRQPAPPHPDIRTPRRPRGTAPTRTDYGQKLRCTRQKFERVKSVDAPPART